jgi:hypothetical protein
MKNNILNDWVKPFLGNFILIAISVLVAYGSLYERFNNVAAQTAENSVNIAENQKMYEAYLSKKIDKEVFFEYDKKVQIQLLGIDRNIEKLSTKLDRLLER